VAIPFINDGDHSFNFQGRTSSHRFSAGLLPIVSFSAGYLDDKRLLNAGAKNWDDFLLRTWIGNYGFEYRPVGVATFLPFLQNTDLLYRELGHPITCIAFSNGLEGRFITGNRDGDVQLWNHDEIEKPDQWTNVSFPKRQLSNMPIRSIAMSPQGEISAACDSETCTVFRTFDSKSLLKISIPKTFLTKVCFCDDDQLAVGTASGIVDVWSISKSVRTHRFFVSQGSITDLAYSPSRTSILASNADGTIAEFRLHEKTTPMIPIRESYLNSLDTSLVWLDKSKELAFPRKLTNELATLDVSGITKSTRFDMVGFDPVTTGQSIIFKERLSADELVTVHREWFVRWNRTSGKLKAKTDYYQHQSQDGSVYLSSSDRHPHRGYLFKEDRVTEVSMPLADMRSAIKTGIRAADLFNDERRLAFVVDNGKYAQFMIRDVDSGAILSDLRIADLRCSENQIPTIACLDEHRVLVSGVIPLESSEEIDLIWDTKDDRITRIESPTIREQTRRARAFDIRPTRRYVLRTIDPKRIIVWDRGRILSIDTQSLQAKELQLPDKSQLFLAHLSPKGDVCVLTHTPGETFRWQEWNPTTLQWDLKFEIDEAWQPLGHESHWCIDPERSTLFHMPVAGVIQRWSVLSGKRLSPLHVPFGPVDKIHVDASGQVAALMNCNVNAFEYPGSLHWFNQGKQVDSNRIDIRPIQGWSGFVPLLYPGQWLTPKGVKSTSNQGQRGAIRFEPKVPHASLPNAQLDFSESSKHLIQIEQGSVLQWIVQEPLEGDKPSSYQYAGSHRLPLATKLEAIDISPSGTRLAISDKTSVQWAIQPFERWLEVPISTTADVHVTALKWSKDNQTVAIGFSTGDMLLYHVDSKTSSAFSHGHQGAISDILWLPDQRTIATAAHDGDIVIWDLGLREIRLRIPAHQGPVHSLAFDSNSQSIFSSGADGCIRNWRGSTVERGVQDVFVPPDPQAKYLEREAVPGSETVRYRAFIDWLKQHHATFELAKFGIRNYHSVNSMDEVSVHSIQMNKQSSLSDDDLRSFAQLHELRSLDLSGCTLTANGLNHLVGLQSLHTLNLSKIDLSKFSFNALKDSVNLKNLSLSGCSISDDQVHTIIRLFPKLQTITLTGARITDASMIAIDALRDLRELQLESTGISTPSIEAIGRLHQLRFLGLNQVAIQPSDLTLLANLKDLSELQLRGTSMDDLGLLQMPKWPSLKKIDLRDTDVRVTGVAVLQGQFRNIEAYVAPDLFGNSSELVAFLELGPLRGSVQVDGKSMNAFSAAIKIAEGGSITGLTWPIDPARSNEDLEVLAKFPKLERIVIASDAIPKQHFPLLNQIDRLRFLEIRQPPYYQANDLESIGKIGQLRELKIQHFQEDELQQVQKLPNLRLLEYNSGVKIDEVAKAMPYLQSISCPGITKSELERAVPFLTSLETLMVRNSPREDSWPELAKLKNLKKLQLPGSFSKSALKKLQDLLPNVIIQVMK
jgi:WD40 repeat protein